MTYHENLDGKRTEHGIDYKGAQQIADDLQSLSDLRAFQEFITSEADWVSLRRSDPETYHSYKAFADQLLQEQKRRPVPGQSVKDKVALSIGELDQRITERERDPNIANYRDVERRVRALMDFYAAGGNWHTMQAADPNQFAELSNTYHSIEKAQQGDPEYRKAGLDFEQTARALIERFSGKALALADARAERLRPVEMAVAPEPVIVRRPHELFTKAELFLPNETDRQWQIIKVNPTKRTYSICRALDSRPVTDLLGDIASGRTYRGKTVGYELSWEEFERYNQANVGARGGSRRTQVA